MAKVQFPLLSRDAMGQLGKQMIFRRGGIVSKYFVPRNPNSPAQAAHRQAFKDYYMSFLTQAQADLLYSALTHLHDDRYAPLTHYHVGVYAPLTHYHAGVYSVVAHLHDGTYSPVGHLHDGTYSPTSHNHTGVYSAVGHTHQGKQVVGGHGLLGTIAAGGTQYIVPFIAGMSTSLNGFPWPVDATMTRLMIATNTTQPASGSLVVTAQNNAADTLLQVTIPAGSVAGTYSDLVHTAGFVAGELVTFKLKNNATGASAAIKGVSCLSQIVTTS